MQEGLPGSKVGARERIDDTSTLRPMEHSPVHVSQAVGCTADVSSPILVVQYVMPEAPRATVTTTALMALGMCCTFGAHVLLLLRYWGKLPAAAPAAAPAVSKGKKGKEQTMLTAKGGGADVEELQKQLQQVGLRFMVSHFSGDVSVGGSTLRTSGSFAQLHAKRPSPPPPPGGDQLRGS